MASLSLLAELPAGGWKVVEVRGGQGVHSPTPLTPIAASPTSWDPQSTMPFPSLLDGGGGSKYLMLSNPPTVSQTIPEMKPH